MIHRWREISRTPEEPGIYAWYFSPEITDFDLEKTIEQVVAAHREDRQSDAHELIKTFLEQALFRYLREDPYTATLRGPLKPTFTGELTHQPTISRSLIRRIVENPERLRTIQRVVERSAPEFSSPLYIGMASSLRSRLIRHKTMIEAPGESYHTAVLVDEDDPTSQQDERDRTFADRIRARKIPPTRLFVVTQVVHDTHEAYIDIENLLNRLHFPLLGRN